MEVCLIETETGYELQLIDWNQSSESEIKILGKIEDTDRERLCQLSDYIADVYDAIQTQRSKS